MQRLVRNYSALFILLYVAVGPVTADPIELTASGTIDFSIHSEELLGFPVAVGDPFSLSFTIALDEDRFPDDPTFAEYPLGSTYTIRFGDQTLTASSGSTVGRAVIRDQFGLGTSGDTIQAFFAGPRQVDLLILSFLDTTDWLHGDGLPPLALLPTVEIPTVFSSTVFDPNEPACLCPFHARITAVTAGSPAPVPEPGTVILFGSGLFGLLIQRPIKGS
jgi:hypothetical protein